MTLQELCKKINRSQNTLKRSFNRTVDVFKKKGILITKTGIGDKADYQITYDESLKEPSKEKELSTRLVGQRFGHLTVQYDTGERFHRSIVWMCKCDCGREHKATSNNLNGGNVKSCGGQKCPYHRTYKDLTGQKFGHLTAMYPTTMKDGSHMYWMCKCDCGNPELKEVASNHLQRGSVQSCGCITISIGEQNIENLLIKNNIPYQTQITFSDLKNIKPLRYDFGIYEKDSNKLIRLIEFDGIQHFEEQNYFTHSLEEIQKSDRIKNNYAKQHNIPLIRIPYTERDKITLQLILGDKYLI